MAKRVAIIADCLPPLADLIEYHAACNSVGNRVAFRNPYYAGLQQARAGDLAKAEALFKEAMASSAVNGFDMQTAAGLALADLYCRIAEQKLADKDVAAAGPYLRQALELDPNSERIKCLMDSLKYALPVMNILAGNRDAARDGWNADLEHDPNDTRAAHSLALLYFYWAREHFRAGRLHDALEAWQRSAECWSMILRSPRFEQDWIRAKTPVYGNPVESKDVAAACKQAAEVVLRAILNAANDFRSSGDGASYVATITAYGMVVGELKAAELLAETANALEGKLPDNFHLGGPRTLARYGGLDAARKVVLTARAAGVPEETATKLATAYSGKAPEWGLLEAKLFDQLVSALENKTGRSAEQNILLAQALYELGVLARDDHGSHPSFGYWAKSLTAAPSEATIAGNIEMSALEIQRLVVSRKQKLGIAVLSTLVEDMKSLCKKLTTESFKAGLLTALHQLALMELDAKNRARYVTLLEEALQFNQTNQAARRSLSAVFFNDGFKEITDAIEAFNPVSGSGAKSTLTRRIAPAIKKLIRSIELDPGDKQAKDQCADVVQILNHLDMYAEALDLLRAMKL